MAAICTISQRAQGGMHELSKMIHVRENNISKIQGDVVLVKVKPQIDWTSGNSLKFV